MSKCTKCGASVTWKQEGGQFQCYDPDGKIHWDTCSGNRWQQTVATGEKFEGQRGAEIVTGYRGSVHGTKLDTARLAKPVVGSRFKTDPNCKQCVPPWGRCPNKCPVEFAAV